MCLVMRSIVSSPLRLSLSKALWSTPGGLSSSISHIHGDRDLRAGMKSDQQGHDAGEPDDPSDDADGPEAPSDSVQRATGKDMVRPERSDAGGPVGSLRRRD